MEKFIVSARKYRPDNFLSLVGQESIATTLKNSIKRGQLAHAYLFCGPRGVGKTSTARIFAKTINCMNLSPDLEPCGECESCRSFAEGRSYCIHELDAASNNSVDDIRLLTEKVRIPPQIGKYSVYIIDEVHMLSASAFNAFLKTLEEPPAHAIFILATTEKHKILPTILSRCQTYDFNRISIEDIVKNLGNIAGKEGISIDSDSLHIIAQKADGAMRDALTLFDQTVAFCGTEIKYRDVIKNLNVLDYEYYFKIVENSLAGDYASSLLLFNEVLAKGFNALYFIGGLSNHFRNLLVCKNVSTLTLLEMPPSVADKYRIQSDCCSVKFLYEALGHTTKCESEYKVSSNQRLLVEFLLLKLANIASSAITQQTQSSQQPQPARHIQQAQQVQQQQQNAATTAEKQAETGNGQQAEKQAEQKIEQKEETKPAGRFSLKGIMKAVESRQNHSAATSDSAETANREFTLEELKSAWIKMGESQSKYPRLGVAIKQSEPIYTQESKEVLFEVDNIAQKEWIERNSMGMLTKFLQDELQNRELTLAVKVREHEAKERKPYTADEKAKAMLQKSQAFQEFYKELDLDIQ